MDSASLRRIVSSAAAETSVRPALLYAVIAAESDGNPGAVSPKGAAGLMQLMPGTAATYGVYDRFDPDQNVRGGAHYLHDLLDRYHQNLSLALAAYNAGPGAVDAARGIPPFAETRAYVARITAALRE
jgi:soluble lytic murein transglycosylase-like protein